MWFTKEKSPKEKAPTLPYPSTDMLTPAARILVDIGRDAPIPTKEEFASMTPLHAYSEGIRCAIIVMQDESLAEKFGKGGNITARFSIALGILSGHFGRLVELVLEEHREKK